MYSDNDFRLYHSAKGSTWKEHKYTSRNVSDGKVSYTYAGSSGDSLNNQRNQANQDAYVSQAQIEEYMMNMRLPEHESDWQKYIVFMETEMKAYETQKDMIVDPTNRRDKMFEEWDENMR